MTVHGDNVVKLTGLTAAGTLASSQYKLVKFASTAGQVKVATSVTSNIAGVLLNDPADGEAAEVAILGEVKVVSAVASVGGVVSSNSTGQAYTTATAGATIVGYYKTAATTAGNLATVVLSGKFRY